LVRCAKCVTSGAFPLFPSRRGECTTKRVYGSMRTAHYERCSTLVVSHRVGRSPAGAPRARTTTRNHRCQPLLASRVHFLKTAHGRGFHITGSSTQEPKNSRNRFSKGTAIDSQGKRRERKHSLRTYSRIS